MSSCNYSCSDSGNKLFVKVMSGCILLRFKCSLTNLDVNFLVCANSKQRIGRPVKEKKYPRKLEMPIIFGKSVARCKTILQLEKQEAHCILLKIYINCVVIGLLH